MTAHTVLLRLDGPLQSWGVASMFERRDTGPWPSKSAVVGLCAAALGRARDSGPGEPAELEFAVRVDQPGRILSDHHVAGHTGWISADGVVTYGQAKLSTRQYLADAVFLAALSGDAHVVDRVAAALETPIYHLYLGRRSCPPAAPVLAGVIRGGPVEALSAIGYQGHRRLPPRRMLLISNAAGGHSVADQPVSYDPVYRRYGYRTIGTRWIDTPGLGPVPRSGDDGTFRDPEEDGGRESDPYLLAAEREDGK